MHAEQLIDCSRPPAGQRCKILQAYRFGKVGAEPRAHALDHVNMGFIARQLFP